MMVQTDAETMIDRRAGVKEPRMYNVIMLNDDVTSVDFVFVLLRDLFNHSVEQAAVTTQTIHVTGSDICGTYTQDIAETKIDETHRRAAEAGFPLRAVAKPAP